MEKTPRFIAVKADSALSRFDRLPWLIRLWLAFQLGVTRKMDRLSVPSDLVKDDPDQSLSKELL